MQTIAITGVGLIGGSLGLALRKAGFGGQILGISSPRTIEMAIARGAIDAETSLEEAAAVADVIYLAQPISVILDTIERLRPIARADCLITDAGSTKARICESGASLPLFLGGHPMAGKESSGVGSADADLFAGRPYILINSETDVIQSPQGGDYFSWLKRCGAVPVLMSAAEHDSIVAFTSHLPQLASTALACALAGQLEGEQTVSVAGPGLRDATRLALSSWSVWKDILDSNTTNVQHALSVYIDKLTEIRDNLQTQRTGEDFSIAAEVAYRIRRGFTNC